MGKTEGAEGAPGAYAAQRRKMAPEADFGAPAEWDGTLTNSSRATFMNCRKKWEYEYIRRLAPRRVSIPFLVGGLFHDGLDRMYKVGAFDAEEFEEQVVLPKCEQAAEQCLEPGQSDDVWMQRAVVMGMLKGYAKAYLKGDMASYKILRAEESFAIPLEKGRQYMGKRDLLVMDRKTEKLVLFEHKTTSRLDGGYLAKLPLDNQILGYAWSVGKLMGRLPERVVYNVAKKPGIRQKASETFEEFAARVEQEYVLEPARYFYRETIHFSKADIDRFYAGLGPIAGEMERCVKTNFFYQNTGHCTTYGACQYMPLCVNGVNKETLAQYRVKDSSHEELEIQGGQEQ